MKWKIKTMSDIAEPVNGIVDGPFGSNLKKTDYINDSENGIPVLTTKNLHGDYSKDSVRYVSQEKYEILKRSTVFPGDILVAKIGSIGTCGIYPLSCKKALIPANLLKISVLSSVDRRFVYYYIQSKGFQERIKAISTATAQPAFNVTKFRKLPIPVPPLSEQERIVARIEELFSQLDAGVETLKKTKAQLAVYRQAVLKEAFSKVTKKVSLGSISDSRLGKMLDKEKNVGIPRRYLRNINVRWFSFDLDDLLEMRIEENEVDKYTLHRGDLVICEGGEPGRCAVWENDNAIFYQKALHRVRFIDNSNPKFYMYYLWYAAQTGELKQLFTGTGIKHLTGQSLVKVQVPIAKRDKQDRIVDEIESRLSVCDSIEHTVNTALQQAEAMRQSILKDAFEGRLKDEQTNKS